MWKQRDAQWGYDGLFDRRWQQPSPKRVPLEVVRQVLTLYRERSFDGHVLCTSRRSSKPSTGSGSRTR